MTAAEALVVGASLVCLSLAAASAQTYTTTQPYGPGGPTITTGPNGFRSEVTSPYGNGFGAKYYSDNLGRSGQITQPYGPSGPTQFSISPRR